MPADTQQRTHLTVLSANHEERLAAQARGEEIAGFAHLAVVPHAVPVSQDQLPNLALEELRVAVELAAERVT
jgi:pyrrolidone-carboxylate peptidase